MKKYEAPKAEVLELKEQILTGIDPVSGPVTTEEDGEGF